MPNTETIVERVYHYYNTFAGIKIADAAVVLAVDKDGIYSVKDFWKIPAASNGQARTNLVTVDDIIYSGTGLGICCGIHIR